MFLPFQRDNVTRQVLPCSLVPRNYDSDPQVVTWIYPFTWARFSESEPLFLYLFLEFYVFCLGQLYTMQQDMTSWFHWDLEQEILVAHCRVFHRRMARPTLLLTAGVERPPSSSRQGTQQASTWWMFSPGVHWAMLLDSPSWLSTPYTPLASTPPPSSEIGFSF